MSDCPAPQGQRHSAMMTLHSRGLPFAPISRRLPYGPYFSTHTLECVVCKYLGRGGNNGLEDSEQKIGVSGLNACVPIRYDWLG